MLKNSKRFLALSLSFVFLFLNTQDISASTFSSKTNVSDIKSVYQKFNNKKSESKKFSTDLKKSLKINNYSSRAVVGLPSYKQFVPTKEQLKSLKEKNATQEKTKKLNSKSYSISSPIIGSTRVFKSDGDGIKRESVTAMLVAIGNKSLIYVDVNAPMAKNFTSGIMNNSGFNENAKSIADEYDNNIYNLLLDNNSANKDYFGNVIDIDSNLRTIILLKDIDSDGHIPDTVYTAGYFWILDFFPKTLEGTEESNEADMLYMDIGEKQGYSIFKEYGVKTFSGTIAHELQHLINWSEVFIHLLKSNYDVTLDEIWLNEGLSGVADYLYSDYDFNYYNLIEFFKTEYQGGARGNSYTPTNKEWENTANSDILSSYAASTLILLEYRAFNNSNSQIINRLLKDSRGDNFSKLSVGDNFLTNIDTKNNKYGFDLFFNQFNLDLAVDSKFTYKNQDYDYRFLPLSSDSDVGNVWKFRTEFTENYKSPTLATNLVKNLSSNNKIYRPDLQMFKMGAENTINFKIKDITNYQNSSLKNTYYIIYPSDSNSTQSWESTPKTFKPITVGKEFRIDLKEGTPFAILGIGFSNPLKAEIEMNTNSGTVEISNTTNTTNTTFSDEFTDDVPPNQKTGSYKATATPATSEWQKESVDVELSVSASDSSNISLDKFLTKVNTIDLDVEYNNKDRNWGSLTYNSSNQGEVLGNVSVVNDGENYIHWYVKDKKSNKNSSGVVGPFKIDKTAPLAVGTAIPVNGTLNVLLTNNSNDSTSGISETYWERRLKDDTNKEVVANKSFEQSVLDKDLLANTDYIYTLVAIDKAGNRSERTIEVKTLGQGLTNETPSNIFTVISSKKSDSIISNNRNGLKSTDFSALLKRVLGTDKTSQTTKIYKPF